MLLVMRKSPINLLTTTALRSSHLILTNALSLSFPSILRRKLIPLWWRHMSNCALQKLIVLLLIKSKRKTPVNNLTLIKSQSGFRPNRICIYCLQNSLKSASQISDMGWSGRKCLLLSFKISRSRPLNSSPCSLKPSIRNLAKSSPPYIIFSRDLLSASRSQTKQSDFMTYKKLLWALTSIPYPSGKHSTSIFLYINIPPPTSSFLSLNRVILKNQFALYAYIITQKLLYVNI